MEILLSRGVFWNLCLEIRGDTHIEHDRLDLFHFFRFTIKFLFGQLLLDCLSDCHHVARLFFEGIKIRKCVCNLLLSIFCLLLFLFFDSPNSSVSWACGFWSELLHGCLLFFLFSQDRLFPVPTIAWFIQKLKELVTCFIVESERNATWNLWWLRCIVALENFLCILYQIRGHRSSIWKLEFDSRSLEQTTQLLNVFDVEKRHLNCIFIDVVYVVRNNISY